MPRTTLAVAVLFAAIVLPAEAQFATVGAGVLLTERAPAPVAELHAETPPLFASRAYVTLSWTDDSAKPTVITAAERLTLTSKRVLVGLGAGLLWLEPNDYRPFPIVVSSTVVPLPVQRTAAVVVAAAQPFQDFHWSVLVKVGITLWFVR